MNQLDKLGSLPVLEVATGDTVDTTCCYLLGHSEKANQMKPPIRRAKHDDVTEYKVCEVFYVQRWLCRMHRFVLMGGLCHVTRN